MPYPGVDLCHKISDRMDNPKVQKTHIKGKDTVLLIENDTDLHKTVEKLQKEQVIGVDLEADSMFHYKEKVCLLQFSTDEYNFVIDPLSIQDLSPLTPVFADDRIRKVFHGADYDIRSLYRDFGIEVNSLFDTQIAAKFLGARETGLANVLMAKFGVSSDKKFQKKDWSQRPLPTSMLDYAVRDTSYLLPLAEIYEKDLGDRGLLFCVEEECELLSGVRPNLSRKGPYFLGFKGASGLDSRSLAVLEKILALRDSVAQRRDRPHFKVLGNKQIMEIAQSQPVKRADLSKIGGLSQKQIQQMGTTLVEKVKEGLSIPKGDLPVYPNQNRPRRRMKRDETSRMKALKRWRETRSEKWGVEPAVVCTSAQIRALAVANPVEPDDMEGVEDIRKWQIRLLGRDICDVLQKTR